MRTTKNGESVWLRSGAVALLCAGKRLLGAVALVRVGRALLFSLTLSVFARSQRLTRLHHDSSEKLIRTALHAYVTHLLNSTFAGVRRRRLPPSWTHRPRRAREPSLLAALRKRGQRPPRKMCPFPARRLAPVGITCSRSLQVCLTWRKKVSGNSICHDHATLVVLTKVGCIDND